MKKDKQAYAHSEPQARWEDLLKQTLQLLWTDLTELQCESEAETARYICENIGFTDAELINLGFQNILNAYKGGLENE